MTELAAPDAFGALGEDATLTLQRLLPGSIDRVWAYLTESDLRRQWLAAGTMDLRLGAPVELVWRNNELMKNPGKLPELPEGFSEEHRMVSEITELDPPYRLSISWGGTGGVTFELEPVGDMVRAASFRRGPIDSPPQRAQGAPAGAVQSGMNVPVMQRPVCALQGA